MPGIVLGYDNSPGARRALDIAIELAQRYEMPLVIVHGIAPPGRVGEEAAAARAALDELDAKVMAPAVSAAEAAGVPTVEVVDDKPAQALVAAADAHDAAVIVGHLERQPTARRAARLRAAQAAAAGPPAGALRAGPHVGLTRRDQYVRRNRIPNGRPSGSRNDR